MRVDLEGKRCLVTGGTGFIGGRLIERLVLQCGAEVRAVVRNFTNAARMARFPVEMIAGDVADPAVVARAAEGCDIVFHCAYGNSGDADRQRAVTLGGTENVLEAALKGGRTRVVNLSTITVYGPAADGDLTEDMPRVRVGDSYSDSKLDAERACLDYASKHSLPVAVLQPAMVFGPFGPAWTLRILNDLLNARVILVNGGDGWCNAVYVDDVVSAMLLAGVKDEALGEVFLVAGEQPVTWKQFYRRHEQVLGIESTVEMSMAEAEALWNSQAAPRGPKSIFREAIDIFREQSSLRWRVQETTEVAAILRAAGAVTPWRVKNYLKQRLVGEANGAATADAAAGENGKTAAEERPIMRQPPALLKMNAAKTHVRIDKARRLLGYRPEFDFESGMVLTEQWAHWAGFGSEAARA